MVPDFTETQAPYSQINRKCGKIAMAENPFLKDARDKHLIDDREIAFMADITCSGGNQGRAWFFLNGSRLSLYTCVGMGGLGEYVEELDLRKARFLKASGFVLNTWLKFQYGSDTYTFKGFAQGKRVVEAVKYACGVTE